MIAQQVKRNIQHIIKNDEKLIKIYYVMLFIIFVNALIFNISTPYIGEDYALMAFYPPENVISITQIVVKMVNRIYAQMGEWNVRVGEQLSIIFGCFDKIVFNVLNSLMIVYFHVLVRLYAFKNTKDIKKKIICTYITFCLLLLFQPVLGEIFFWKTGSTNYLWALCLLLTFLLPLRFYIGAQRIDIIGSSKLKTILLMLIGLLAGCTNENTVGAFWILYLGVILYCKVKSQIIPRWVYGSFCTYSIGFIYMLKAPSTVIRMNYYKEIYGVADLSLYDYFLRALNIVRSFFDSNYAYFVITILLMIIMYKKIGRKHGETCYYEIAIFMLASIISVGAMVLSPYIEIRAFFLTDFMMLVSIVFCCCNLLEDTKFRRCFLLCMGAALIIPTILMVETIYITYRDYNNFCIMREELISSDNSPIWAGYYGTEKSRILNTREDYLMWNDKYLDEYYGKDIIVDNNAIYDLNIQYYSKNSVVGNIESISYDEEYNNTYISGWIAFSDIELESGFIDVYLEVESEGQKHYYKTNLSERSDVAEAMGSEKYRRTGYFSNIPLSKCEVVTAIIVDRKNMHYGEIERIL